ncbi:AAA family ATPase [Collinsella sp. An2]|uniref:AAA family ATPase n=1 Tax=Collinsella sp. An2 TaxID=1965585 RepID=UPI000B3983BE|nr:AAA family ATPase [Collinsella sp. An2]OUP09448.1 hypothetical protein B5F33_04575 [Collinsella sp. An2]
MALLNPFRPTAGAEPPVLIGRSKVTHDFIDGLEEGIGSPARLMRITGPRGSGKTVLLTELGDIARDKGWRVVDVTAVDNVAEAIRYELEGSPQQQEVSLGANLGLISVQGTSTTMYREESLRGIMTRIATEQTEQGRGLLVTIDEIQDADEHDIRLVAATVQHLIRERQNIAFVFAGITTGVLDLINGKALTFLRRAKSEELAPIAHDDVARAFRHTIEHAGMSIDAMALDSMAQATAGYAYLIQLVGYHVWAIAREHAKTSLAIDKHDVQEGVSRAMDEFGNVVLETALADLPLRAIEYALAMTEDQEVSATAEIAERLHVAPSSLTSYRRMLIKHQVIEPTARGFVAFSIPYMRDYLRKHGDEIRMRYIAR